MDQQIRAVVFDLDGTLADTADPRTLIGDLWSSAGVTEPAQIDAQGQLRLRFFDPDQREHLRAWAEARGFGTSDAVEID